MTDTSAPVLVILAAGLAKRYGGCKPLAPLGLQGEAVIDLTASDALGAGFADVVTVLGPATGPAIEYHIRRTWPRHLSVTPVYQDQPLGTAHAVLCARQAVGDRPCAVVNGDDVYGPEALAELRRFLTDPGTCPAAPGSADRQPVPTANHHALVSFSLANSVVGTAAVTRGTVQSTDDGFLSRIDERRLVHRRADGTFAVDDGHQPATLDPSTPVSVNLWGFRSGIWNDLQRAVAAVHPQIDPNRSPSAANPDTVLPSGPEVLLPEVVGALVSPTLPIPHRVRVLSGPGRCVGVTHAADLPEVRATLATMVARGERPARLWTSRC